jgi:hypothetical protein
MNDPLIEKIKEIVENLSSPAYPFMNESYEDANVLMDQLLQTKTALLVSVTKGEFNIEGNGLSDQPYFTLCFCKPMPLNEPESQTLEAIFYELKTDAIEFIKAIQDTQEIIVGSKYQYERAVNFLDINVASFYITFNCKLRALSSLNC